MTQTFTPPAVSAVPAVSPDDHPGNRLMRYYRARPEGVNVYLYKAGSRSAAAHGRVDETDPITLYDSNGVATTNGWDDIEVVFWGGHEAVVVTAAQAAALQAAGYTIVTMVTNPPVITSLAPSSGVAATLVQIIGTDFDNTTSVTVAGQAVSFTQVSSTVVTFTTPTHADGAVSVALTTGNGVSSSTFTFATPAVNAPPAITALSPTSGVAGSTVLISGTTFGAVTTVTFDGVSASFVINSATSITATAPTHADGAISVVATDANGASNNFTFTYATPPAPVITNVSPATVVATSLVTLTGTTFTGATSVTVGGTAVAFTLVSSTSITFTAPAHVDGAYTVTVTTPNGSGSNTLTYLTPAPQNPPVLTSATPASSPSGGGVSVVFVGTSLDIVTQLTWAGTPVAFTINSPTQITSTAPAHAVGTISVIAQSANGPSNSLSFVYADADPHPLSDILLESGSFLLLEDGTSTLLLE